MKDISNSKGLLALSPILVLVGLIVGVSLYFGDFYKVPLVLVFIVTACVSLLTLRGVKLNERIKIFSKGAGEHNLMLMIWIFVLAGAFAASAKAMGAVDAMVNMTLNFLPPQLLLPGVFVAACLISLSIGTSVGTVSAMVPVVIGLSQQTGIDLALIVAATVGGAFFGDNLSFISDTTVVATKTQGCKMSDKFRTNFLLVLPAAVITIILYTVIGFNTETIEIAQQDVSVVKVIPYIAVLVAALCGVNVLVVLFGGVVLTGIVGLCTGSYSVEGWFEAVTNGIWGMTETILIALLAGGLLAVIRHGGGIAWIIQKMTRCVSSRKGGELSIGLLVSLVNFCTANNTVAILSVGQIAKDISQRYGINPKKTASILDTFSCFVQGIIPYGAQLLIASGLVVTTLGIDFSALPLMQYLYYPYLLGVCAVVGILLGFPRMEHPAPQSENETQN